MGIKKEHDLWPATPREVRQETNAAGKHSNHGSVQDGGGLMASIGRCVQSCTTVGAMFNSKLVAEWTKVHSGSEW